MPWRNGGGVTLEIARAPAEPAPFDWRLSLATIESSGPFSDFAGYSRAVTLIAGPGCRLDIADRPSMHLDTVGTTVQFPGDVPTLCTLIDGPCRDLSLMTRDPGLIEVDTLSVGGRGHTVALANDRHHALFCLQGSLIVRRGDQALDGHAPAERAAGNDLELDTDDSLLFGPSGGDWTLWPSRPDRPARALWLRWTAASAGNASQEG